MVCNPVPDSVKKRKGHARGEMLIVPATHKKTVHGRFASLRFLKGPPLEGIDACKFGTLYPRNRSAS